MCVPLSLRARGWVTRAQVHGDVFRPPDSASLLSVYVGTGVQILGMVFITMVFAVLGFLSPANRGGLMTAMLLLFVLMGIFAGYFSARYDPLPSLPTTTSRLRFERFGLDTGGGEQKWPLNEARRPHVRVVRVVLGMGY